MRSSKPRPNSEVQTCFPSRTWVGSHLRASLCLHTTWRSSGRIRLSAPIRHHFQFSFCPLTCLVIQPPKGPSHDRKQYRQYTKIVSAYKTAARHSNVWVQQTYWRNDSDWPLVPISCECVEFFWNYQHFIQVTDVLGVRNSEECVKKYKNDVETGRIGMALLYFSFRSYLQTWNTTQYRKHYLWLLPFSEARKRQLAERLRLCYFTEMLSRSVLSIAPLFRFTSTSWNIQHMVCIQTTSCT